MRAIRSQLARHPVGIGRVVVLAAAIAVPYLASALWLNIAVLILFAIIGAQSLNLLTGLVGQVSVGNAAFLALGSFGAVFGAQTLGLTFVPCVLLGVVVSAVIGAVLAVAAFRLRGLYLALSTIALLYAVTYGFNKYQIATVGASSFLLEQPEPLGIPLGFGEDKNWYFVLLVFVLPICWGFANLCRTRFGRAAAMVRERENEAAVFGIAPRRIKLEAFVWSSALIGFQAGLYAYYLGTTGANVFTLDLAIQYIAMVVIGGLGFTWGAVIGAAYVTALPFALDGFGNSSANVELFIYGLTIVLFLLVEPAGIVGLIQRIVTGKRAPRRLRTLVRAVTAGATQR